MKEKTLNLSGRIDAQNSVVLEKDINALLDDGVVKLIINMKDVDFLTSMGIRVLLSTYKKLKASGGSLTVVEPSNFVLETLHFVGLDEHIVDMNTVQPASEEKIQIDYDKPLTLEVDVDVNDLRAPLYAMIDNFADTLRLSGDVRNALGLTCAEVSAMADWNKQEGYCRNANIQISYTPEPRTIKMSGLIQNHSKSQMDKNTRRMNEKKFDVEADNYDAAAEYAKRAHLVFWDTFDTEQRGNDFFACLLKRL